METKPAWEKYDAGALEELEDVCAEYIQFITENKTEREFAAAAIAQAEKAGYTDLYQALDEGRRLSAGDKVYAQTHGKAVIFAHLGTEPLVNGFNILGAHIDSPRLDLKQNPLFERNGLVHLDTHYYGGIKHYQWVTLPLALHGVIAKKDGSVVQVNVGEDADDPVFCVSDLLIHLAKDQMKKTGSEVVAAEDLDVLVGSRPMVLSDADKKKEDADKSDLEKLAAKEPVKAFVLQLLAKKYGMEEEDCHFQDRPHLRRGDHDPRQGGERAHDAAVGGAEGVVLVRADARAHCHDGARGQRGDWKRWSDGHGLPVLRERRRRAPGAGG